MESGDGPTTGSRKVEAAPKEKRLGEEKGSLPRFLHGYSILSVVFAISSLRVLLTHPRCATRGMFGTQSGYSEAIRRAIPPEEIRTLQRGMLLVLSGSQASFQVFTLPYYEDDDIATRAHIPIAQPQPQRPYQAGYQAQGGQQQVDPR